jgi:hypothetical protein
LSYPFENKVTETCAWLIAEPLKDITAPFDAGGMTGASLLEQIETGPGVDLQARFLFGLLLRLRSRR